MKILYSCLSQSWGGMEMFTVQAVSKLLERKIYVELLCYPNSRISSEAEKQGIVTHHSKHYNPNEIIRLARFFKKNNFDLIHTQASKDLWLIVPALKLAGSNIPLILTKQLGSFIAKKDWLHKWIYKRVSLALAISRVIKQNLMDTCPLTEDKIKLLHNSIDTKKFDPNIVDNNSFRWELNICPDKILIAMLARFSTGKGHEEIIEAARTLTKKYEHLRFVIVGEASRGENEYYSKIRNLVKEFDLGQFFIFTGFRKDTPEVLAGCDIFAFPSHSEAFGIALVEAMAMGKPAVCSNSDGVLDIAVDNETALYFEKKNALDLAAKLEVLILNSGVREKFGRAARQRAVDLFDVETLTDKVIKIYSGIITERK